MRVRPPDAVQRAELRWMAERTALALLAVLAGATAPLLALLGIARYDDHDLLHVLVVGPAAMSLVWLLSRRSRVWVLFFGVGFAAFWIVFVVLLARALAGQGID